MSEKGNSSQWIDAANTASEALAAAKSAAAVNKAHMHVTMLMLAALAKTAPREHVDQLLAEFERVRDLTGPAGAAANEVFAVAVSTLERFARKD
ncbi:MAG TPA: hypothetical protein VEC19_02890 [Usitatibacter sp.]|nr:hypothetical protein [Usitatibacter sp.]